MNETTGLQEVPSSFGQNSNQRISMAKASNNLGPDTCVIGGLDVELPVLAIAGYGGDDSPTKWMDRGLSGSRFPRFDAGRDYSISLAR